MKYLLFFYVLAERSAPGYSGETAERVSGTPMHWGATYDKHD